MMKKSKRQFWLIAVLAVGLGMAFTYSNDTVDDSADWPRKKKVRVGTNVGDMAPEISSTTPDGKTVKLSSLKGKVVLVDFWASWCGPCRRENPNVVSAYNKYKSAKFKNAKGFEIFSVSLDKSKDAWKRAITTDKLTWKHHVSELKGWQDGAARTYGVNSIPQSFLIGPDGIIIAKNLRGMNLHTTLDGLVSKL